MHFQFLIEDRSSDVLINVLMKKLVGSNDSVTYKCKPFQGLGGFTKKQHFSDIKTGKLLNDLRQYLRGFDKSLMGIQAVIIVVLDNDRHDTYLFRKQLEDIAANCMITVDHVFCIAVEEVEAWLLGDTEAVMAAYPNAKPQILHSYVQDSICGTWEKLADAVYPGGVTKLKKDCPTYCDVGKIKCEWAAKIGEHMNISENQSPSFNSFIGEIQRRIPSAQ